VALTALDSASGHVADTVLLQAHDIGLIDPQGQVRAVHDADVTGALAWTGGRLVFRDAPLRDVIAELARWYDLDIQVRDSSVAERRLTASFSGESVPLVLERIALSLNLQVDSHGRTIVFRSRH
jgi:transmembrane sensor